MNIEWNKVTWYSKLAAIILFVGAVPALTFYIGKQYGEVSVLSNEPVYNSPGETHFKLTSTNVPVATPVKSDADLFTSVGPHEDHDVERFGFHLSIPDWMNENWVWGRFYYLNDTWDITPKKDIPGATNGIYFYAEDIAEEYNAGTLYENRQDPELIKTYGKPVLAEILLNNDQDTRIYHVQYEGDYLVTDEYYMDGTKETIRVTVSLAKENYAKNSSEIRKFLQSFKKTYDPQG
jgi:hypothetical protein